MLCCVFDMLMFAFICHAYYVVANWSIIDKGLFVFLGFSGSIFYHHPVHKVHVYKSGDLICQEERILFQSFL